MKKICSLVVAFFVFSSSLSSALAEEFIETPSPFDGVLLPDPEFVSEPEQAVISAEFGDIQISEILSNASTGEQEWVEIVSLVEDERSLAQFTLSDAVGVIFTFPEDAILAAHERVVLSGWANKLNNTGDSVVIKNSAGEIVTQEVTFPALSKEESWAFNGDQYLKTTLVTPGEENEFVSPEDPKSEEPVSTPEQDPHQTPETSPPLSPDIPYPDPGEVIISEVVSNPLENDQEWVELFSQSSQERSLKDCTLSDENGVIFTFRAESTLLPFEFLVLSGWGNKLNNTGDSVVLRSPDGKILAEALSFPPLEKGESWLPEEAKKGIPTKGEENILLLDEISNTPIPEVSPPIDEGDAVFPEVGDIFLSEIMSNPLEGDEWVELFSSAIEKIYVGGMGIYDEKGKIFTIPIGTVVEPGEFLVISGWKNKLNNDGDSVSVRLIDESIISEVDHFPSLEKGVSWAFDGQGFKKTGSPTPGQENVFTTPAKSSASSSGGSSTATGKKSSLVKTKAVTPSAGRESFQLQISEVLFRGAKEDYVELYCKECDLDLGGIRLADDDTVFEFPPETYVKSGEYVLVHFSKESQDDYYEDGVWHFWSQKKGLTATDETIFVLDSRGNVEDALCIANQNGDFSSGEKRDITQLIHQNVLKAHHPLDEEICFDSRKLQKDIALVFSGTKSLFASHDYFASTKMTPGQKNPLPPQHIRPNILSVSESFLLPNDTVVIKIQNGGTKLLPLGDFSLAYDSLQEDGLMHQESITLPDEILVPQEMKYIFLPNFSSGNVQIVDHWGDVFPTAEIVPSSPFLPGWGDIRLSEIFPNPEGADAGSEYIELLCESEQCNTDSVVPFVNSEKITIPETLLKKGETFLISDVSLRNTNLSLEVYDFSRKTLESVTIAHAPEGESYSMYADEFSWEAPTRGHQNMPADMHASTDSDHDGIPDVSEWLLDSNPFELDEKNSPVHKLFSAYVKKSASLTISEEKQGVRFSGKTLPHAKVVVVLHSHRHSVATSSDENGVFSFVAHPDIQPGNHQADMIIASQEKDIFVIPQKTQVRLTKNHHKNILHDVSFALVLPNPTGSDAEQETVILQNNEDVAGWIRGVRLLSQSTEKTLPDMYFKPRQRKMIPSDNLPNLNNTKGELRLVRADTQQMDSISWSKAKEGQWFGEQAPVYVARSKKKSKAFRKKPGNKSPSEIVYPMHEYVGTLAFIEQGQLGLRHPDGKLILYRIDNSLSSETLSGFLSSNQQIRIQVQNGAVMGVDLAPQSQAPAANVMEKSSNLLFVFLLLLLFLGASTPLLYRFLFQNKYAEG